MYLSLNFFPVVVYLTNCIDLVQEIVVDVVHRGTSSLVDNKHGCSSATAGRHDSNLHSSVFEFVVVFPQPDVAAHIAFRLIAPVTVEYVKNLLENTGVLRGEGNAALLFLFCLHGSLRRGFWLGAGLR